MENVVANPEPKVVHYSCNHQEKPVTVERIENGEHRISKCCQPCANILISKCDYKEVRKN